MADYEDKKSDIKSYTLFNNESGQSFEIPILKGTEGPDVLDIRSLHKCPKERTPAPDANTRLLLYHAFYQ